MGNNYFRFLGMFLFSAFLSVGALAQWNTDLSKNLLVSEEGKNGQSLVQMGAASDGGVYIAWISWENSNYYVKLQALDKQGNNRFGNGGMYICRQPTPSWSSGYGFTVTDDNCVVIVNPDMRNGEWQAYAYKISPEGEHLWNPEGIALMKSGDGAAFNPKVCQTAAGNLIIGYKVMGEKGNKLSFSKLGADGVSLWGSTLDVRGTEDLFGMVLSGRDGFIVTSFESGNYYASRYSGSGDMVWDKKAVLDESGAVKVSSEPFVVSDGMDGLVAGWRYAVSGFSTGGKVRHIDSEGNRTFPEDFTTRNLPFTAVDKVAKQIYVFSSDPESSAYYPLVWKMDYAGKHLWDSEGVLLSAPGTQYSMYGINQLGNDVFFVYRHVYAFNRSAIEYTRINENGEVLMQNVTICNAESEKDRGGISPVRDGQFITAWSDELSNLGGNVYAQNTIVETSQGVGSAAGDNLAISVLSVNSNHIAIRVKVPEEIKAEVSLTGINGNMVAAREKVFLHPGDNLMDYPVNELAGGMYILWVKASGEIRNAKVMVTN